MRGKKFEEGILVHESGTLLYVQLEEEVIGQNPSMNMENGVS